MKFQEDTLNGFKVTQRTFFVLETATYKVQRGITQKVYIREYNIKDTLNGFQVAEWKRFCDGQTDGRADNPCKNNMSPSP